MRTDDNVSELSHGESSREGGSLQKNRRWQQNHRPNGIPREGEQTSVEDVAPRSDRGVGRGTTGGQEVRPTECDGKKCHGHAREVAYCIHPNEGRERLKMALLVSPMEGGR